MFAQGRCQPKRIRQPSLYPLSSFSHVNISYLCCLSVYILHLDVMSKPDRNHEWRRKATPDPRPYYSPVAISELHVVGTFRLTRNLLLVFWRDNMAGCALSGATESRWTKSCCLLQWSYRWAAVEAEQHDSSGYSPFSVGNDFSSFQMASDFTLT